MAINMTFGDTANNFADVMVGLNNQIGGKLAPMVIFLMAIIMFVSLKRYPTEKALIVTGAVSSLIAILFWAIGFLGFGYVFIPIAILFIGIIWESFF